MNSFSSSPPVSSSGRGSAFSPAVVSIIAVLGSAFLVVSYYRIFSKLCTRWQARRNSFDLEAPPTAPDSDTSASALANQGLEQALIKKIPTFTFNKADLRTEDTDCAVCLSEFVEDEKLRMLPKCGHAFHIACIDTWLASHSSCPLCRAIIWPDQTARSPLSPFTPESQAQWMERSESATGERVPGQRGGGGERTSSSPTLRGLLRYEDDHQHTIWVPSTSEVSPTTPTESIEDSTHPPDIEGRSPDTATSVDIAPVLTESEDMNASLVESRFTPYLSTGTGPESTLTRTTSCKESHSRDRDSKWQIPVRRPSLKNSFALVVRSYSMGTSRRLVHALEFLDLEDYRVDENHSEDRPKMSSPSEYGIPRSTEYSLRGMSASGPLSDGRVKAGELYSNAGSSNQLADWFLPFKSPSSSSSDPDLSDSGKRKIKSSSPRMGNSKSLRSSFLMKRSNSQGISRSFFKSSSKGRIHTSHSPTRPLT